MNFKITGLRYITTHETIMNYGLKADHKKETKSYKIGLNGNVDISQKTIYYAISPYGPSIPMLFGRMPIPIETQPTEEFNSSALLEPEYVLSLLEKLNAMMVRLDVSEESLFDYCPDDTDEDDAFVKKDNLGSLSIICIKLFYVELSNGKYYKFAFNKDIEEVCNKILEQIEVNKKD